MNRLIDKLVFALYFLPLIFIMMFADFHGYFTIAMPIVIILSLALASHFMWYGYPRFIWIGNIISFVTSLICVMLFLPESKTGYYFKPLGPVGTLVLFSVLSCIFQYTVAWLICNLAKRFGIGEK